MIVHATAIVFSNRAAMIIGPAGSGKSSLALDLMSRGAHLISDDRVELRVDDGCLWACAPEQIAGMIEARGIGILAADFVARAKLNLVVDLSEVETRRLPEKHSKEFLGHIVPCVHKSETTAFPAAILQYLKVGLACEQ
ncbi:MAG: HPr kinase/phosphatase C-terminal domain-containing protein [Paracoccaceae bacterium]